MAKTICELAIGLLQDTVAGEFIRRRGLSESFSATEASVTYDRAAEAEFLKALIEPYGPKHLPLEFIIRANIDVALGVARHVNDGLIASFDDPEAHTLIEENAVSPIMTYSDIDEREIEFDTFFPLFVEYYESPELPTLLKEWDRALSEEDSGYYAWADANQPSFEILRRHGLIKHINFAGIAFPIFFGSGDHRDEQKVREFVSS